MNTEPQPSDKQCAAASQGYSAFKIPGTSNPYPIGHECHEWWEFGHDTAVDELTEKLYREAMWRGEFGDE